jgi:putative zinc finger/helix-turn-helix YgiT family protein
MICLRCDNEEFVLKQDSIIAQEFRGDTFRIQMPALACSVCGWTTIDAEQTDELRRRTADAYRTKHGLLTSEEIKTLRQLLGKTQREFASMISVGEASIKRWETWLVQEKSSDQLIRLKCEKELSDQLAQKATPIVWISSELEITETSKGIMIQTAPSVTGAFRGEIREDFFESKEESQMSLCDVAGSDICGLSPPRSEVEHFLFQCFQLNSLKQKISKKKMLENLSSFRTQDA